MLRQQFVIGPGQSHLDEKATKKNEDEMAVREAYVLSDADHLTFLIGKEDALLALYSLVTDTLEKHGGLKMGGD